MVETDQYAVFYAEEIELKQIGVGVIGWGFMGRTHTLALKTIPLYYPGIDFAPRLAAVCSRDAAKAARARDEIGFDRATGDWRELLADPAVEAVSICTPNDLHEEMAVAALRAGKHVYLDKPMAHTLQSAQAIGEAARASGTVFQLAHNHRFLPATLRMREMAENGEIGEVLSFSLRFLHSGSIDEKKPAGWKMRAGGGVILDLGSHIIDLGIWLMGMPEAVFCANRTLYGSRPAPGGGVADDLTEDHSLAIARLPGGALGTLEASKIAMGAGDELYVEIRGRKGSVKWSLNEPGILQYFDAARPDAPLGGTRGWTRVECESRYPAPGGVFLPPRSAIGWERGHIHCYYSFLDCVAHHKEPSPSWEDGIRTQRVMDALSRSAEEGQWIRL